MKMPESTADNIRHVYEARDLAAENRRLAEDLRIAREQRDMLKECVIFYMEHGKDFCDMLDPEYQDTGRDVLKRLARLDASKENPS